MIQFFQREVFEMRETLGLAFLCLLIAVASFAVMLWVVVQAALQGLFVGEILTLDGLLMISICLLFSVVFGFCFLWLAHDAHLWEMLKGRRPPLSDGTKSPAEEKPPPEQ